MASAGGVTADYAYGVALDTYLADRDGFRAHVLSLRKEGEGGEEKGEEEDAAAVVAQIKQVLLQEKEAAAAKEEEVGQEEEEEEGEEEESEMESVLAILCDGCDGEFILEEVRHASHPLTHPTTPPTQPPTHPAGWSGRSARRRLVLRGLCSSPSSCSGCCRCPSCCRCGWWTYDTRWARQGRRSSSPSSCPCHPPWCGQEGGRRGSGGGEEEGTCTCQGSHNPW